jgi:hypothetical protein
VRSRAPATTCAPSTGRAIDPPLLLCLDEAANVAPLPNLDELASTGPGQGVQLLSVFQNISQISDRWGRDRAETIVANHRARLFGSGIGDRATLEYLRAVLGEEEIERISTHRQRLELDLGSRTYSHDYKPLAAPNHVRQADSDAALLRRGEHAGHAHATFLASGNGSEEAWRSCRCWFYSGARLAPSHRERDRPRRLRFPASTVSCRPTESGRGGYSGLPGPAKLIDRSHVLVGVVLACGDKALENRVQQRHRGSRALLHLAYEL